MPIELGNELGIAVAHDWRGHAYIRAWSQARDGTKRHPAPVRPVRMGDVQRACPGGVSYPTVKRALADLKREGRFRCLGKGRAAIAPAGAGEAGATGSEKGAEKTGEISSEKILVLLRRNPRVSARGIAGALGLTSRAVEKHLSKLKQEGRLKRIGPDKGGRWKVTR